MSVDSITGALRSYEMSSRTWHAGDRINGLHTEMTCIVAKLEPKIEVDKIAYVNSHIDMFII